MLQEDVCSVIISCQEMQLEKESRKSSEVSGPDAAQMCRSALGQIQRIWRSIRLVLCCIFQQATSLSCGFSVCKDRSNGPAALCQAL